MHGAALHSPRLAAPRPAAFKSVTDVHPGRGSISARPCSAVWPVLLLFCTRITTCYVTLIELRLALIPYQDYRILLLTLADRYIFADVDNFKLAA